MFWEIVKNKDFFTSLMELLLKIFSPFGGKEFPKGFEGGREMKAGPCQSYIFRVLKNMITSATQNESVKIAHLYLPKHTYITPARTLFISELKSQILKLPLFT